MVILIAWIISTYKNTMAKFHIFIKLKTHDMNEYLFNGILCNGLC